MTDARSIRVRGVVQGVGFRPHVFRLARTHALTGWVRNGDEGVQIHVEGPESALQAFVDDLVGHPPPAATIAALDVRRATIAHYDRFDIRESRRAAAPTTRISPDLPVCDACLRELLDAGRRCGYPYVNCTDCGPRYSIVRALPYDRAQTTMAGWPMCEACAAEYADPADRRFHAQPIACPACGPRHRVVIGANMTADEPGTADKGDPLSATARLLREGRIVAIKGIGGYHLACDASRAEAVRALRERKYRKEKPFAIMVPNVAAARALVELTPAAVALLTSAARPIVLARACVELEGVAPGNSDLGVMLPYTPVHHLLFARGAPSCLVMTSGNLSSEPIAYLDDDARADLEGIADAWLVGERPIARRLDDSVVRAGTFGPAILRRARGYAPGAVATLPATRPVLAVGADLKNTITLVVNGQAYVSQHTGDLEHVRAVDAFHDAIDDFIAMYDIACEDLLVVSDRHPGYISTGFAANVRAGARQQVQHHRAHIASVLAERGALDERVLGVALDGTGYGDDGTIWGGEFFAGSVYDGFDRVASFRPAALPGGDAAARYPVQAAAGFLAELDVPADLAAAPFCFPERYGMARTLVAKRLRTFTTTSAGRLFDTAAAVAGFTDVVTYEAQAAIWLEHLARQSTSRDAYPISFSGDVLDWRPALMAMIEARAAGVDPIDTARAFHRGLAGGLSGAIRALAARHDVDTVVLSGGVCQNELLMSDLEAALDGSRLRIWTNAAVPCNDGGISLGQAALAIASVTP